MNWVLFSSGRAQQRQVNRQAADADAATLSVSSDGRSALLTILERSESDLMYVASVE